jgi:hypothetical protein
VAGLKINENARGHVVTLAGYYIYSTHVPL